MNSKKNTGDLGLGEIVNPIMDLLSTGLVKLVTLLSHGLHFLVMKYVFKKNRKATLQKVERKDLAVSKRTLADNAIGYSITQKRNILGHEINKGVHTAIVGASRSGKTVLLNTLIYEDLKKGNPVVFIDPKGDNATLLNFINMCKLTGRDYFAFSDYWSGEGACTLNPAKDGSSTNIADRIHHAFTWTEEHYAQICRDALEDAVAILIDKNEEVSLESIYAKLLDISDPKNKDSFYSRNDVQGILSRLRKIIRSDFGKKLKGTEALSFKDIRESGKCVYIGLSVLGYAEIARSIGKVLLGDISHSVYDAYKVITPEDSSFLTPISIYIDELGSVITHEFVEVLNKVGGAKMELNIAFQSPSDILKVEDNLCIQVLENTSNWFVLKQRMESAAGLFSESIGTLESKKQTVRVKDGEEQAQGSQRVVEELIVHHNIIKNLNVGQSVLLRHYPSRVDLVNVKYIDPVIVSENVRFLKLGSKGDSKSLILGGQKNNRLTKINRPLR